VVCAQDSILRSKVITKLGRGKVEFNFDAIQNEDGQVHIAHVDFDKKLIIENGYTCGPGEFYQVALNGSSELKVAVFQTPDENDSVDILSIFANGTRLPSRGVRFSKMSNRLMYRIANVPLVEENGLWKAKVKIQKYHNVPNMSEKNAPGPEKSFHVVFYHQTGTVLNVEKCQKFDALEPRVLNITGREFMRIRGHNYDGDSVLEKHQRMKEDDCFAPVISLPNKENNSLIEKPALDKDAWNEAKHSDDYLMGEKSVMWNFPDGECAHFKLDEELTMTYQKRIYGKIKTTDAWKSE